MKRILIALIVIFAFACADNDDEKLEYIENLPIPFLPDNSIAWGMKKEVVHNILKDNGYKVEKSYSDTDNYWSYTTQEAIDIESFEKNGREEWFYKWKTPLSSGGSLIHTTYLGYKERFLFDFTENKLNAILYYTDYFIFIGELDEKGNEWKIKVNSLAPLLEDKILPIAIKLGDQEKIKTLREMNYDPLQHEGKAVDLLANSNKWNEFHKGIDIYANAVKWDYIEPVNNTQITCYTNIDWNCKLLIYAEKKYSERIPINIGYPLIGSNGAGTRFWALEFKPLN